ncbi:siderophore-interacting protein [Pseudoalteromonas luteoviolacea]|uniref:siderophore-interacting protein n=1 Tax=Pseudoalteromonas luteoviolacea TaxID=43657 RepID=UPI001B35F3E8|nr:siderophore-interacting protein [Pseudoalteromonas luteoviolacea]MBQ4837858.1 siderophore-interacting protein [Pseudoalteromonas luteoviolacea]
MAAGNYRKTKVLESEYLSPNMKRVVLTGPDLASFPSGFEGGYVKLLFTKQGRVLREDEAFEQLSRQNIMMRTYTVRGFDKATQQLTLDFALHSKEGSVAPASDWARMARVGDEMIVGGPGSTIGVDHNADWFLFVGDMTAIPAISCYLTRLPDRAKGTVILEVTQPEDILDLTKPSGIEVIWKVNNTPGKNSQLLDTVQALDWMQGHVFVWCACEFDSMKALRRWFKRTKGLEKEQMYVSSYWKYNCSEDEHKVEKLADSQLSG